MGISSFVSLWLSHTTDEVAEAQHMCPGLKQEKPQSTHGQAKIRDYVHRLLVLLQQHNARIAF